MTPSITEVVGSPLVVPTISIPVVAPYEIATVRDGHIVYRQSIDHINKEKIMGVINRSLDDTLVAHYFDDKQNARFYIAEDHLGAGVLQGVYIDILGVDPSKWGNGIASALMHAMMEDTDGRFVLRSQPIPKRERANGWYTELAERIGQVVNVDGINYNVYARGIPESEKPHWLRVAREKPKNFE